MSLQLWLPLTENLNNNGTSTATITNNGATVNNSGKIGGCYSFNGSNNYLQFTYPSYSPEITFALWVKFNSAPTGTHVFDARTSDSVGYQPMYITSSSIQIGCGSNYTTFSYSFSANIWYHICVTHNSTQGKCYINGTLLGTSTTAIGQSFNTSVSARIGSRFTGVNFLNGCVNDVRIYDTCLSAAEVKNIAAGLILHYPLSDNYFEATTNICNVLSSTCYNGATGKYGYGTETDMYKTTGTFQGRNCTKVYMGTSGLSAWPFVFFDSITPAQNQYKTLSFDYYPTVISKVVFYSYNVAAGISWRVNYSQTGTSQTIPVTVGKWNHIELTLLATGSSGYGWGYMRIGDGSHTSDVNNYWLISNIQVEAKNHATGYTANSRVLGTIYDCSGYGNHGEAIGDVQSIYDTPRNTNATSALSTNVGTSTSTGAAYIRGRLKNPIQSATALTIAWWGNMTNWSYQNSGVLATSNYSSPTDYQDSAVNQYDSYFQFNTTSYAKLSATNIIQNNAWHHYALTYDGTTVKGYRDGILIESTSLTGALDSFSYVFLGLSVAGSAWRQTVGKWSDFRVYATALTQQEITELYSIPILITKNGTLITNGEIIE